jgi:hypothetical protein
MRWTVVTMISALAAARRWASGVGAVLKLGGQCDGLRGGFFVDLVESDA